MSKRSGYSVKITAFVEADPKSMASMKNGTSAIEGLLKYLVVNNFVGTKAVYSFMLSKDIPDEPPAAELAAGTAMGAEEHAREAGLKALGLRPGEGLIGPLAPADQNQGNSRTPSPLDIPTALRRA